MARLIAFYLPQYHPVPENDAWWGKGFTEWTNVAKARPMFRGHYQPHVPADLGFYDLRVPETRAAQAEMAREYGIEAFCYYHYWFAGKRILERPFNEVLRTGNPDFPFCLCWANQTWTGIWHGCPDRILAEQTYPGLDDHRAHFEALLPAFTDRRYVTVDGKPLFLIFNWDEIPHVREVTDFWRTMATKAGLQGLHLVAVLHHKDAWNPGDHGFDACVRTYLRQRKEGYISWRQPVRKVLRHLERKSGRPVVFPYSKAMMDVFPDALSGGSEYLCLIPNWDNTPRCGTAGVVQDGSTPELFRVQVKKSLDLTEGVPPEHRIIFVKSWNEWAEGNHVEPDLKFGTGYLKVLHEELQTIHRAIP